MGTVIWRGDAPAVAQVDKVTPGGTIGTETFTLTMNGKSVTYTANGSDTVATVCDALVAAWNASTVAEHEEVTASDSTTYVTFTADTEGKPFTLTSIASGSATNVRAAVTACSGPNFWSIAANWDTAAVPVDTDDVILQDSDVSVLYGLDQSAVALTSLTIAASFTGDIGLPVYDDDGDYYQYRETYLEIGSTTTTIGSGPGSGMKRGKLNLGTGGSSTLNIHGSGSPADDGLEAILIVIGGASNVLNYTAGSVGVAVEAGQTGRVDTVRQGYEESRSSDTRLRFGAGVTLSSATITKSGGVLQTNSAVSSLTQTGGDTETFGSGTITTLNIDGGAVYHNAATITTLNGGSGGKIDLSRDMRDKTITNCVLSSGFEYIDPNGVTVGNVTNGIQLNRCGLDSVKIDLGEHLKLTPASYS